MKQPSESRLLRHALFGSLILRAARAAEIILGREVFFATCATVQSETGRVELVRQLASTRLILKAIKNPKGCFAGEEFREYNLIRIKITLCEL